LSIPIIFLYIKINNFKGLPLPVINASDNLLWNSVTTYYTETFLQYFEILWSLYVIFCD
jgi:hypothetical protein